MKKYLFKLGKQAVKAAIETINSKRKNKVLKDYCSLLKKYKIKIISENKKDLNPFDLIKTIAVARIMMPKSYIRLSAGRTNMNDSTQALAFFAGANSIFQGDVLLTAPNPDKNRDALLFDTLGLNSEKISIPNNA